MIGTDLERFDFSGPAATSGLLTVPLGATPGELQVEGSIALQGNRFFDPRSEVTLEAITGQLNYDRNGVKASGLDAAFQGKAALLDLLASKQEAEKFRVDMRGKFAVKDILPPYLLGTYPFLDGMQGESEWLVSVVAATAPSGEGAPVNLIVESDLKGVSLGFPEPLFKPAGASWPLHMNYSLSGPKRFLDINLAGRMSYRLELIQGPGAGSTEMAPARALLVLMARQSCRPRALSVLKEKYRSWISTGGWT
jgi:uncharacterized protein YhdP